MGRFSVFLKGAITGFLLLLAYFFVRMLFQIKIMSDGIFTFEGFTAVVFMTGFMFVMVRGDH